MSVPFGYKYGKRKKPRPFSEEHKSRISKNSARYWKGKKRSKETRDKISKAKKLNPIRYWLGKKGIRLSPSTEFKKGRKPHNWKGGAKPELEKIRDSVEFKEWRKLVFARDGYKCASKGCDRKKLNAHHINNFISYPEGRLDVNNGITLCEKCHIKFHKKYGRTNNTKEQLEEFLQIKLTI